jgi:uncharacterized protein (DUF1778 family)
MTARHHHTGNHRQDHHHAADASGQVLELDIIHLSRKNSERFAAALLEPPRPTPALRQAFAHRRRLIRSE